jgi:hypothetical protein
MIFKVGDRVKMNGGRGWHGEIIALCDAYPRVHIVTVQWDSGLAQNVNTFMMQLVLA